MSKGAEWFRYNETLTKSLDLVNHVVIKKSIFEDAKEILEIQYAIKEQEDKLSEISNGNPDTPPRRA